mmetsp:Transcript_130492/g.278827  ORF Transcript_130492/g.278827 Transcript_130492/m.278827 type:complete len:258 (-) Transcript_130492:800-1573(-)
MTRPSCGTLSPLSLQPVNPAPSSPTPSSDRLPPGRQRSDEGVSKKGALAGGAAAPPARAPFFDTPSSERWRPGGRRSELGVGEDGAGFTGCRLRGDKVPQLGLVIRRRPGRAHKKSTRDLSRLNPDRADGVLAPAAHLALTGLLPEEIEDDGRISVFEEARVEVGEVAVSLRLQAHGRLHGLGRRLPGVVHMLTPRSAAVLGRKGADISYCEHVGVGRLHRCVHGEASLVHVQPAAELDIRCGTDAHHSDIARQGAP